MKKNVKKVTIGVLSCSLLLTMSACGPMSRFSTS